MRAGNAAPQVARPVRRGDAAAALAHDRVDDDQADEGAVEHQLGVGEIFCAELDEYAHAAEQKSGDQHPQRAHIKNSIPS